MPKKKDRRFVYLCPDCGKRGMKWERMDETAEYGPKSPIAISCSLCGTKKTITAAELNDIRANDPELRAMHRETAQEVTGKVNRALRSPRG